ncbi:MAG: CHRD domain-containing protein [Limimaricola sp.]|uniref:CHRD domain-containing protein n=1 Tax=Limimaricola sp. TaxID=2211665 RepID=UPI001D5C1016|nr:CHRD domain-containing protein [Limimaricola sp.]MBI1418596.1 CHRD domain-containing protein [Limimaricola sp.]
MLTRLTLAAAIAMSFAQAASAEMMNWSATLDQAQETSVDTAVMDAKGSATGTLDTDTGVMTWNITFEGLSGDATGMHFHGPAAKGADAGVAVNIGDISGLTSPSAGQATLTADQMKQVEDGMWYINIHTSANVKGEIRGQVMPAM